MKKLLLLLLFIKMIFVPPVKADWVHVTGFNASGARDIVENNGVLYAGSYNNGVYASTDNGVIWTSRNTGLNTTRSKTVYDVACLTPGLFIATTDGIFRSTNDGWSWEEKNVGIQIGPGAIYYFAYSLFEDGGALYAGTFNAIYKSTDGGDNWAPVTTVTMHKDICSFNRYDNLIIAGTSAGNSIPLIATTNNGSNWASMYISANFPTSAFCIYSEPGKIFAGTLMGMYMSTNSGANWISRSAGLSADPYVFDLKKVGSTLFSATNDWVYKSTNDGLNWSLVAFSGQTFQDVNKMLVYNNKLYVAAYSGLWYHELDSIATVVENPSNEIPGEFKLSQNYPNPFNPTTKINYDLKIAGNVTLKVFDYLGREAASLVNGKQSAGSYSVEFDASFLASGVYFYKLETDEFSSVKKMTIVK